MTPVYQTIIDPINGNCMQAAVATLFDMKLEEVPHFLTFGDKWFSEFYQFIKDSGYGYYGIFYNKNYNRLCNPKSECFEKRHNYRPNMLTLNNLIKYGGVNGYFYAGVLSPKYFDLTENFNKSHAVIIDLNCNVVHDPNPDYKTILKYPLADLLKYNGIIDVYDIRKK
jgi:hypothetical protein